MSALLKRQAQELQHLEEEAFKTSPIWHDLLLKINNVLFAVHAQLRLLTPLTD